MLRRVITEEIAEFMVLLIELTAIELYGDDRAAAFKELNDRRIWHGFVEKYEEKRALSKKELAEQIGKLLGKEQPLLSQILSINDKEIEFIKKVIQALGKKYDWNYSVAFENFYSSDVCKISSGANVHLSAFTLEDILELFGRSFTGQTH